MKLLLSLTLILAGFCTIVGKTVFGACMSGWPNDFVIGEEIGGNNKVRESYDGRVVTLDGYIYYFGELMPTETNKCGELLFTPVFVNDRGEYVHVGINRRHFHKLNRCVFAPFKFGHYGKNDLRTSRTAGMWQKIKWGQQHRPWEDKDRVKYCKISLQGRYVYREHFLGDNPRYTFKGEGKTASFVLDFFRPHRYRLYLDIIRIFDLSNAEVKIR